MAALLAGLLLLFALLAEVPGPRGAEPSGGAPAGMFEALRSRWAVFGAVAIGLYVGAEVSVGSIMINFLNQRRCSACRSRPRAAISPISTGAERCAGGWSGPRC